MLRRCDVLLKKGWTHSPGKTRRGGKNLAWRPKLPERTLNNFVPLNLIHPRRRPNTWQERQFNYLGYTKWPKDIGFYNAGNNFELTPEASWRLFLSCRDEVFWSPLHNEKTVIQLMPLVEEDPKTHVPRVTEVLRHHLSRFGADHYIYNSVMQAQAFAKDWDQCLVMWQEMLALGLEPNGQTYVNMMLAAKLCGRPKEECEKYFQDGVAKGALQAVMRLDTEFAMWMSQLDRLGSFTTTSGYLSVKAEGAKPMPEDMWALWGWHHSESKFISRSQIISQQVASRLHGGRELVGTVYTKARRQPWALYNGMLPHDYNGPPFRRPLRLQPEADTE